MSHAWIIIKTRTKWNTQQGKQIIRNAILKLIQGWNTKMQGKNMIYARRWLKWNFILITYEKKSYDKKT